MSKGRTQSSCVLEFPCAGWRQGISGHWFGAASAQAYVGPVDRVIEKGLYFRMLAEATKSFMKLGRSASHQGVRAFDKLCQNQLWYLQMEVINGHDERISSGPDEGLGGGPGQDRAIFEC